MRTILFFHNSLLRIMRMDGSTFHRYRNTSFNLHIMEGVGFGCPSLTEDNKIF